VSPSIKAPLVLFTYFNPIIRKGMDRFCKEIKEAGASGAWGAPGSEGRACDAQAQRERGQRASGGSGTGRAQDQPLSACRGASW